ncbi:MAG: hypothetical protein GY729_05550 [Desulfobacteraceae bacterium]|nr:hypothetical protein [Desulfobacteraceae bacterium]
MGNGLFERYKDQVEKADEILGYSIKTLCLEEFDRKIKPDSIYTACAFCGL